ncbi:SGNH/GDSL hydrolase family protein [Parvularcula sp. ZS-1/3]|uniref:SGNH/GDSL hydrolase family protein n=1 Tax=Parvularcula mediterranea TaxID=2732508 RepID=A0A7Y3W6D1_9PROT|nr:SGNH/GDSL hydrolase family protein [Parvularcula mediterranea]NNU17408.1 SGNH/GDSL hydrolase family protein [Parvularcula mediterranea]
MKLQKKTLRGLLMAGAATGLLGTASAQQVYSFGDSLSDTGNANDFSLGLVAGGDYFDGRFSNGYLWTDYISYSSTGELQRKNPGLIGPYFTRTSRPYNFAHGGAVSGKLSSSVNTGLLSGLGFLSNIAAFRVVDQAKHFRDQSFFGRTFRSSSLDYATISAGGNDYFAGETDVVRVVNNIFQAIDYIDDGGIRSFFLLDVPNVGDTPANFGTSGQAQLNALSQSHNVLLRDRALLYEAANPGSILAVVPAARLFELVREDALLNGGAVYGFTNVQPGAGTTGNCLGDGLVLSACPRGYLFYDDIHPTAPAHYIVADLAIATFQAKLYGFAEPLARTSTSKQTTSTSSRVVANRVQALKLGLTGSAILTDPFSTPNFSGIAEGNLGMQTIPGQVLGEQRFSVYSFAEGSWSELAAAGRDLAPQTEFLSGTLGLTPGETTFTMGADYLLPSDVAIGANMTRGSFDRQNFGALSYDETRAVTVYGAMFRGPMTYTLKASSTINEQQTRRQTFFRYQPFVNSDSRSALREVTAEADYGKELGAWRLGAVARAAAAVLDLDAFEEEGSRGLLDRSVRDQSITGYSAYLGLKASRALPRAFGYGQLTFQTGPVAGSDRTLGYAGVVGDALLFGSMPDAISRQDPMRGVGQEGLFGSASLQFSKSDRMSFAARAAGVQTLQGADHVVELNAAFRF